jgi:hypothetical protein
MAAEAHRQDNRALTKFDISNNSLYAAGAKVLATGLEGNHGITELNLGGNRLGVKDAHWNVDISGVIALADTIPDMGAISSVNLLKNHIGIEQALGLVKIMQSREKLITLCGLSKEETELDFSGQNLGAGDAVLIANDISDMRALAKLDISNNHIEGVPLQLITELCDTKDIELDNDNKSDSDCDY